MVRTQPNRFLRSLVSFPRLLHRRRARVDLGRALGSLQPLPLSAARFYLFLRDAYGVHPREPAAISNGRKRLDSRHFLLLVR
jgi:hypothetical protein